MSQYKCEKIVEANKPATPIQTMIVRQLDNADDEVDQATEISNVRTILH